MMRMSLLMVLLLAGPAAAQPKKKDEKLAVKTDARLVVGDAAGMFSAEGIKKAKAIVAEVHDHFPFEMTIITTKEMPADRKKDFDKLDNAADKPKFYTDWAIAEAKLHKARGIFVLVCRSPGHIHVLADKAIRDKGLTIRDEELIRDMLLEKFREAKDKPEAEQTELRDKGLVKATEFVRDAYKKMIK